MPITKSCALLGGIFWKMLALLKRAKALGIREDDVEKVLNLQRPLSELGWLDSREVRDLSLKTAQEMMQSGRYIEYDCYDNSWNQQGRGAIKLGSWLEFNQGLFTGEHGPSSDGYYEWFVSESMGKDDGAYHICSGPASRCRVRLPRGDRRQLIHIDRWRMLTPFAMLNTAYLTALGKSLGEQVLAEYVDKPAEEAPPGPVGDSGLAQALEESIREAEEEEKKRKRHKAEGKDDDKADRASEGKSAKKPRSEPLGDYLASQVEKRKNEGQKKKKEKKKKKKRVKRDSLSPSSSSTSDSAVFQSSLARGGNEVWKTHVKYPGQLTQTALLEMTKYLSDRTEVDQGEEVWAHQKVVAYLNQIFLAAHPVSKIGLRTARELQTLATTLDLLLGGRLPEATDLLIQRFKALEASQADGGWATARHLELIPSSSAGLAREEEKAMAAKAELRALKLKEAINKVQKNK